jgi:hypothetical protein
MTPLVLAPLLLLLLAVAVLSWLAARVTRTLGHLRDELVVLSQLAAARELLAVDLDRTRQTFHRTANGSADVWPPRRGR